MTRLPNPGGDDNQWGDILNAYLEVSLSSSGALNNNVVGTNQIQNNAVTNVQLDSATQTTLASVANKYTLPAGGIPSSDMTTAVQTSLGKADSSLQSGQLGAASGIATLDGSATLTSSQLPSSVVTVIVSPGATTDVGAILQAAFDTADTVKLMPKQTYYINTPIFLDGTSKKQRVTLDCQGATLNFGSGLPTASAWASGTGVTPKVAFFPGTLRSALSGGTVTTSSGTASASLPAAPRLVIKNFVADATGGQDVCLAFGNQAATVLRDGILSAMVSGISWTGYTDENACEHVQITGATSPGGAQTRLIFQRDSGDGTTISNCKAYGGYLADLASCLGFLIDSCVSGQVNLITSSGTIMSGHEETDEISSETMSFQFDRSQVTMLEQVTHDSKSSSHYSYIINDTASTSQASRLILRDCRPIFYINGSDQPRQPTVHIAAANNNFVLRCEATRSVVQNSYGSGGIYSEGGIYVDSAVSAIQTAINAGAVIIANGNFELRYNNIDAIVAGLGRGSLPSFLSTPTLSGSADTNSTPGTLTPSGTYQYVAALKAGDGSYTPLSSTTTVTANASGTNDLAFANITGPALLGIWRVAGSSGVTTSPDHYIEIPIDSVQTVIFDTGAHCNGRSWTTSSIPVPNTVAGPGNYSGTKDPSGAVWATFDASTEQASAIANTSRNLTAALFVVPPGMTRSFSNINMRTGGTTSGTLSHFWWAITDVRGNVLAVTADTTSGAIASGTVITTALTSRLTLGPGLYYCQRLIDTGSGGTMPNEMCSSGSSTTLGGLSLYPLFGNSNTSDTSGPPSIGSNISAPSTASGQIPLWWGT